MKISREDVLKVAALANLELADAEVETYRGQLDDILTYIEKLNEIDTSDIEPMTQVVAASAEGSTLREDVVVRSDVITEVLSGAPDPDAPYFRVPRVIEK
jgi:aspartyl-tRNA(Asn)/glutamyl-tRNA(Gln) amidotransferase subunit C